MKKLLTLFTAITLLSFTAFGQEKVEKMQKLESLETDTLAIAADSTAAPLPDDIEAPADTIFNENITANEAGDQTTIHIGKKKVIIENDENEDENESIENENENDSDEVWEDVGGRRNFKSHLGGFELGFNSYASKKFGSTIDGGNSPWDLNSAKSTSFNFIFPAINVGLGRHIGFATSIGFNFNNYRFDKNYSIEKNPLTGITEPVAAPAGINYDKSKLATVYATLPVILEAQIPVCGAGNTLNFGAGVIGAIKLGSHTKVVYTENDKRQKEKNHDDFNLNLLRYGFTGRVGYKMVQIYGNYYMTPLFENNKGPEFYPFEVGIALTFKD